MTLERLRIEKLVPGALGLSRLDGRVVLTPGVLPGELIEAEVSGRGAHLTGVLVEILEPSEGRCAEPENAPPTMDFGFATYAAQLEAKREFVRDSLIRIAKVEAEVLPVRPSPLEWQYRNGAQYLITPRGLAYRERKSHKPVIVRSDPLVCELISDGIADLDMRQLVPASEIAFRASLETGEVLATLVGLGAPAYYHEAREHLRDLGISGVSFAFASTEGRFRNGVKSLWGLEGILERYGKYDLTVTAHGFAQVNPGAAGELYAHCAELAGTGTSVLDLFGGSGGLAMHLTGNFEQVHVLEINTEAVERGRADAERLGLNVEFVRGDVTRMDNLTPDVITLDPPRAGLTEGALEMLAKLNAAKLVYVSCDPATWARDVARLVTRGYMLSHVQPWDFYPQTHHVEVVSLLERI
jgi:23S rRNA (uracil1939-C5)-methyltransferase